VLERVDFSPEFPLLEKLRKKQSVTEHLEPIRKTVMLNGVKHLNGEILRSAQNDKGFSDRLLPKGALGHRRHNAPLSAVVSVPSS
jgi:hypothetical protein